MSRSIPYQQCRRCVMDTSDPDIYFDSEGYCNHCTDFLASRYGSSYDAAANGYALATITARMKAAGKGRKYDCLLGVSGGVDSCYAAWQLKQMGLRPLLVHMDNGWNAEEAVQNIRQVAELLQLDYESYVLDWEEFRGLQLAFLNASVVEAETPTDIAIAGALHRTAARYGIRYIVSGSNHATEGILPRYWHYDSKDLRYLKSIHHRFGTGRLQHFPSFSFWEEVYYKFVKGIRMVYLLNYLPYDKAGAMDLLKGELGWKYYGGKHHESRYTRFIQSYLLPAKFNIDYRRATFSTMICAGAMSREEALDKLETPPYNPATLDAELHYVAKKLEISRQELEAIIGAPVHSHHDYPNNERWLSLMYRVYRRLFTLAGVAIAAQLGGVNSMLPDLI